MADKVLKHDDEMAGPDRTSSGGQAKTEEFKQRYQKW